MTDCATTSALLDVYADDEASPETNALVQAHLRECARCEQALRDVRALKMQLRDVLGRERAPEELATRIRMTLDQQRPRRLVHALRNWLAPASAAAVLIAAWTLWPGEPVEGPARSERTPSLTEAAVSEHIACALDRRVAVVAPTANTGGFTVAMPWIRDRTQNIRVIDAHTCGAAPTFSHVVVSVSGSLASVLIAPRADDRSAPVERGGFDVNIVPAAAHTGFLIAPRAPSAIAPAWRAAVLDRVARFLQQLEGTL
jgi:anti-sigma factor RsiW